MSSITSTGLGSGLDINTIVTAIVDAEKDPALAAITEASAEATAIISSYGLLNSELTSFKSSYKELAYNSSFVAATTTSSDSSIIEAELGYAAETGSWEFEVKQRAQAQTLVSSESNAFTSVSDEIGEGILTLTYGSYSGDGDTTFSADADKAFESITITNTIDPATGKSNNSLEGLRDEINDADNNYSVSASIINDGNSFRLILTSKETGENRAVELTATDLSGDALDAGTGLDRFTYSADSKNMTQTVVAQDAELVMNGITISSDTNEVDSVISGVTLNLNGAEEGKKVTVKIDSDTTEVEEKIQAFLENYNNTVNKISELTAYNGEGATNGILNGDSTVRNIQTMMRGVLNTQVEHIEGSIHSFADLGMLTQRDGTLEIDSEKLAEALKNDLSGVADFFTATGAASDSLISFESNNSVTKAGTYDVEVTQIATKGLLAGTIAPGLTMTEDNNSFQIQVDGFDSSSIDLSIGSFTSVDELIIEMQSKINSDSNFIDNGISVKITNDDGKLSISSNTYGSSSKISFIDSDVDFLSNFGFSDSTAVDGVDVQGTIGGEKATGTGQYLFSDAGDSTGIKLLIDSGALGSRGTVTYSEGLAQVMNNVLDSIIDTSISESSGDISSSLGVIDGKIDSYYKKIADLEEQQEDLTYRMDNYEARLYTQYNAMDIAVSNLSSTLEYLTTAFDSLPGYTND